MIEITQEDLVNWRAAVRKQARNCRVIADTFDDQEWPDRETQADWQKQQLELTRLGDWLDSLTAVSMGKAVNGHNRVSL